ncbi:MAG: alpha/beta hydrolase [bacterium]|nr:alpha/beta hydrolase [bacterium]
MPDVALTKISTVQNPLLDVVFVHGLGGSSTATWDSNGTTWPSLLAANRDDVAVWTFDYPAEATKWNIKGNGLDLDELGRQALDYLTNAGLGQMPLVWVAHSLGGLVVKQLLRYAVEKRIVHYQPIYEQTLGVAFLATPHAGSRLASLGNVLSRLARLTDTTRDLEADNPQLEDLGRWYRETAPKAGIATVAYAETIATLGAMVVEEESADPRVPDCMLVPTAEDHLSICKPADTTSQVYVGVNGLLDRLAEVVWGIMGNVERSIRNVQRTIATVGTYSPSLLEVASPEAAQQLDNALDEIGRTYKVVKRATATWVAGALSSDGLLDPALVADLVTENFGDMIREGRGHCHTINDIYASDIQRLINATAIPADGKNELHHAFHLFSDLDMDLFGMFERAGDYMHGAAKEIGDLRTRGMGEEAAALLRDTYPTVVHLAASVTRAHEALEEVRNKLT